MLMRKIAIRSLRATFLLSLALFFLVSCVSIDSRMTIRDNGSGTLALTYRISQLVVDLGISNSGKPVIPLPVSKDDFERSLAATNGKVRLTKFDRSENEQDVTIKAELSFDSLDALAQVEAFHDADLKRAQNGSLSTFSQVIARAPTEPLTEDTERMIDALFDGYDLTFVVETPRPIQNAPIGTVSPDRKTLTYQSSIKDVMNTKNDILLSVSW
jgi:hypothetical protein